MSRQGGVDGVKLFQLMAKLPGIADSLVVKAREVKVR